MNDFVLLVMVGDPSFVTLKLCRFLDLSSTAKPMILLYILARAQVSLFNANGSIFLRHIMAKNDFQCHVELNFGF
jgi:hypothetical protein